MENIKDIKVKAQQIAEQLQKDRLALIPDYLDALGELESAQAKVLAQEKKTTEKYKELSSSWSAQELKQIGINAPGKKTSTKRAKAKTLNENSTSSHVEQKSSTGENEEQGRN